jgi:DNA-binding CsgD family transcriptional regulator
MSAQGNETVFEWERLTYARLRVLRELADGRTLSEIAERNQVSYDGVRSVVEDLKEITGCADVRAMGGPGEGRRVRFVG